MEEGGTYLREENGATITSIHYRHIYIKLALSIFYFLLLVVPPPLMCVYLSVCLSVCLSICISLCVFRCVCLCVSLCLSEFVCLPASVCVSLCKGPLGILKMAEDPQELEL